VALPAIDQPVADARCDQNSAYWPPRVIRSACVPLSCTVPSADSTTMLSAAVTVDSLCAMTTTVLPFASRRIESATWSSFSGSSALVASSNSTIGAFLTNALAIETRWRSPPDSEPPSPTRVCQPSGSRSTTDSNPAERAASSMSASLASGRPMWMFSHSASSNR